ncbi:MAG: prepilin-type N-terminal cleavage/methylation domain-containing protein [Clostridia bacterium]|nr:prepilin-type N-terminal cleavage/methylation domain-containing protein [Clostridia bacterium]
MTMMQKMQAKKSKKGFTLVELVIVIAILAILAAIAIPVITTTINSAKLSTIKSDATTVDMVLKEAVNTSMAKITTTTYNSQTYATAKVSDVLTENDLDKTILETRFIGGDSYNIGWSGQAVHYYKQDGKNTVDANAFWNADLKDLEPDGAPGSTINAEGQVQGTEPEQP